MPAIDLKNTTINVKSVNETVEVKIGEGNLTWTETYNRDYILDKGNLDLVRNGDQAPLELTLDATFEYYSSATGVYNFLDIIKGGNWIAPATDATETTAADACSPYACDIEVIHDPNCASIAESIETFLFPEFRLESLQADLSAGTFSLSGKCNVEAPTVVRS